MPRLLQLAARENGPLPRAAAGQVLDSEPGPGVHTFRRPMTPFGAAVTLLEDQVGSAAKRKLLRSTFYKGMAALRLAAPESYPLGKVTSMMICFPISEIENGSLTAQPLSRPSALS